MKKLNELILAESQLLEDTFLSLDFPELVAIEACKAFDFWNTVGNYDKKQNELFLESIKWGFPQTLKLLYKKNSDLSGYPLISDNSYLDQFANTFLFHSGKVAIVKQLLEYEKANLISFVEKNKNEFQFEYVNEGMTYEYFENKSLESYFAIINDHLIKPKEEKHIRLHEGIKEQMKKLVDRWRTNYIKYDTNADIDEYYSKLGYFHLIGTQLYDSFEVNCTFGGIPFKKYLDVLQDLMGKAFKHVDYCMLLLDKYNDINLKNILCIPYLKQDLVSEYANFLSLSLEEVNLIFDSLTVNKDNIDTHSLQLKSFSPPLIQITKTHILKSVCGMLQSPMIFLLTELKKRFNTDYFVNINLREKTFRKELYGLFIREEHLSNRLITVDREIRIKIEDIHTDIDAIIYDKKNGNLGLFQLKWQDIFSHNMRERFSRITNLYPKATEWIEKMNKFISNSNYKEILQTLGLPAGENNSGTIYLFVINRGNTHFTGFKPDDRAAWGSWYHVFELSHKIATNFDDPIRELYFKLKYDSPLNKLNTEHFTNLDLKFNDFRVSCKK